MTFARSVFGLASVMLAVAPFAQATDFFAANTSAFLNAINQASPGDTITLQAGTTYALNGGFSLPNKGSNSTEYITIRSSAVANLPAGVRVSPSNASSMPKIRSTSDSMALGLDWGAHHWRLQGLEITVPPNTYAWNLLIFGYANETSDAQLPHHLDIDRCYLHGDPIAGTKRGIALNGKVASIHESYLSDFKSSYQDAQAIMGWNGPGPYSIVNNYVEASGENIMFGGAKGDLWGVIPSDITIRQNTLAKPMNWSQWVPTFAGQKWFVKNLLELKNAQRVTIDGNLFEYCWADQQGGTALLWSVRTEYNTMPWAVVKDVTFSNNIVRHVGMGLTIAGHDDDRSGSMDRIRITNNLFVDLSSTAWGGTGRVFTILNKANGLTIDHNTSLQQNQVAHFDNDPETAMAVRDNIFKCIGYCFSGAGIGNDQTALNYYAPGTTMQKNVLIAGSAAGFPSGGNFTPATIDAVRFANVAGGDYSLAADSPYKRQGTDGKDIGADIDALNAAVSGSSVAPPQILPVYPPVVTPPVVTPPVVTPPAAQVAIADGIYEIVSRSSGLALDVRSASNASGAMIQQWPYGGGANQRWNVRSLGSGVYKILSLSSGKALDIAGISTAGGAPLQQWDYWGGPNQQFTIQATDSNFYKITNVNSNLVLDVSGYSTAAGAQIQQWAWLGGNNQQWAFIPK